MLACDLLKETGSFSSAAEAKRKIAEAIKQVASRLGNTPSVCRKCYVHPAVLEAYLGGTTMTAARKKLDEEIEKRSHDLRDEEQALIDLLEQRLILEATA